MCLAESSFCYDELLNLPDSCFLTSESLEYLMLKFLELRFIYEKHRLKWICSI